MLNFVIGSDYRLNLQNPVGVDDLSSADAGRMGDGLWNVYRLARRWCKGRGLDIGPTFYGNDPRSGFPGADAVDPAIPGSGEAEDLSLYGTGTQDFVFSSHTLEHVSDPEQACRETFRVLKSGGVHFLYLPFPGHSHWDPQLCPGARAEHKWQPDPTSVSRLLLMAGFRIEYCEHSPDNLFSFVVIARKP